MADRKDFQGCVFCCQIIHVQETYLAVVLLRSRRKFDDFKHDAKHDLSRFVVNTISTEITVLKHDGIALLSTRLYIATVALTNKTLHLGGLVYGINVRLKHVYFYTYVCMFVC